MEVDAAIAATYANDANGSISIGSTNCGTSECNLVVDKITNPNEYFQRKYAKWWPFRLIKIANLPTLLAIIAVASICASIPDGFRILNWSGCRLFGYVQYDEDDQKATMASFTLTLAVLTFGMHWVGRKKANKWSHFMASVGITDICLSILMLMMLFPIFYMSTLNTITEIRWYYPRLLNESMTLAQFVEWEGNAFIYDHLRHEYDFIDKDYYYNHRRRTTTQSPVPTTPSARILAEQEKRKNAIMTRLWMDPAISFFAFLAFVMNLVYAVRLIWLFKKTKMWSSDYRGTHPNCSQLDMEYARFWPFGLLKVVQWVFPVLFLLMYLCITFQSNNIRDYSILGGICLYWFFQWLFYVHKVRLHPVGGIQVKEQHESAGQPQHHQLAGMCKLDLLFSIVAILVYLSIRFVIILPAAVKDKEILQLQNYLLAIAISLNAATILFTLLLLKRHAGSNGYSGLGLNIPGISINISINIQKNDAASWANSNMNAVGNANVEEGRENVIEMPKLNNGNA